MKEKSKSSDTERSQLSHSLKSFFVRQSPMFGRRVSSVSSAGLNSKVVHDEEEFHLDPFLQGGLRLGLISGDQLVFVQLCSHDVFVEPLFSFKSASGADQVNLKQFVATNYGTVQVSGSTMSTYPMSRNLREGSPVCDTFAMEVLQECCVSLCVADGCGWGKKSLDASVQASSAFLDYIRSQSSTAVHQNLKVEFILLRALAKAHERIMDRAIDGGTTTLIGGVLLPFSTAFQFSFVSIGDCKAFLRIAETGEFVDLNSHNRAHCRDSKDPGGRIGFCDKDGEPDLRNLFVGKCFCSFGDLLFLMSDGVSDNFDPELQGCLPSDCGFDGVSCWDDMADASSVKSKWCCLKLAEIVGEVDVSFLDTNVVVQKLITYCKDLTKSSREFLESFHGQKLPSDFKNYPGKMDHSTCVCVSLTK